MCSNPFYNFTLLHFTIVLYLIILEINLSFYFHSTCYFFSITEVVMKNEKDHGKQALIMMLWNGKLLKRSERYYVLSIKDPEEERKNLTPAFRT